jgi:cell division protein FtsW
MTKNTRRQNSVASFSISNGDYTDATTSRKHRPDYQIVLFMGLLMLLGLIIIYAIGPQRANVLNNAYGYGYSDSYFFIKQIVSLLLALGAFFALALIPFQKISKYADKLLIAGFAACAVLAIASFLNLGIAQETLGATRWFNLGPLGSLQPAEFLKFAILLFVSSFLAIKCKQNKLNDVHDTLIPIAVILAISMFFVVGIQKDLGTGISIVGIVASMLFLGGINKKNGSIILAGLLAVGAVFIIIAPHRVDRIVTYLKGDSSSSSSSDGDSYHIEQAKTAIGSGGLFGVGIGNSVQATGYLPEAINDSVFAIMGETFGLVGLITILALFSALLLRLLKIFDHLIDVRSKLLVAGVFGWMGSHVILNVASMVGVFPLTGITLPLLSFGGTSMLFIAAALGLAFQLSGLTVHTSRLKEAKNYENLNGRRGLGRSRNASRGGYKRN